MATQPRRQHDGWSFHQLDRAAFSVVSSFTESDRDDDQYWWAQSAEIRLRHVEQLRQMNYEYHATSRLQRVFEVVPRA